MKKDGSLTEPSFFLSHSLESGRKWQKISHFWRRIVIFTQKMRKVAGFVGLSLAVLVGTVVLALVVFIIVGAVTDYRPKVQEPVLELYAPVPEQGLAAGVDSGLHCGQQLPDSLNVLCWNIGYGGLGDNMDFFYDGGTRVRDTEARTKENLAAIIATIRRQDADIVLLQEVDRSSKRTYHIDECAMLHEALPEYYMYFAYNYRSFFVPKPLREPIGKVGSGLVILSKYRPEQVIRHQYPSKFPFPVSMFNLKRCLMTAHFSLADGRTLVVGNTHNTAYDTGNMRSVESDYLAQLLKKYEDNGTEVLIGGDWNQYPASYEPSAEEDDNENFSTVRIEEEKFTPYGRFESAAGAKTLRHLDRIYDSKSVLTVTDYFFLSHDLQSSPVTMLPLNFRHSDHNPVSITIKL